MRSMLVLSALLCISQALAQDEANNPNTPIRIGQVDHYTGRVFVHINDSPVGKPVASEDYPLHSHDIVRTKRNSQAFISLVDNSKVLLGQRSTLTFDGVDTYDLSQSSGKVIFQIYKKDRVHGVRIKTKNAIIGVKGTTFAVDTNADGFNLYMEEGTVSVQSLKGEFDHYKKSEISEFEKYQQQYNSEYEQYKSELKEEFHEYVKSLSVSGGDSISVVDNKIVHVETPPDIKQMFQELNSF